MKKNFTAICFAFILAAAIITTGRTIRVSAANTTEMTQDGFEYWISGEEGEEHAVILGYGGDASEVTVPSEIEGVPVTEVGDRAFMYAPKIVKIVLPESVTTVHERSFWYLDQLEDVTLGGVKYFRDFAGLLDSHVTELLFGHCEQLKRITFGDACCFYEEKRNDGRLNLFPEDVLNHLEYIYIGNGMPELPENLFWGNSLKEIEVGSDNEHYASANGVLFDSEMKTLLTAPIAFEGDTFVVPYGVETIAEYGFDACKNIKKIYIPQTVETFEKRFTISPTLYVVQGSAGETFAKENGFSFQYFGVYFNRSSLNIPVGESASLQVTNETERSLTYNSSDSSVADMNSNGTVTAKKAGTAVISVSDGREFTAKCTVTVTEGGGTPEGPNPPEVKPGISPAEKLNNAKQQSKLELESYKNASDYRDAQKAELANAIQSGKEEIDKAANETEVKIALNTAKAAIDRIKTDAQLMSEELRASGSGQQNVAPLPQPTSFKGKIKAKAKWIQMKWKKISGVTGYEIQISPNKKFKKSTYTRKFGSGQSAVRLRGLKPKTKYYVRIRTYQTAGGKIYYSKWSKKKSVKTKK